MGLKHHQQQYVADARRRDAGAPAVAALSSDLLTLHPAFTTIFFNTHQQRYSERWSRTHAQPPPLPQSAPRLSTSPRLGLHRSILLCRHIASRSSLVSGSDGHHALLLTAGQACGVAVSGLPSPPPSSQHVRLSSMAQLEPHHPHRAWDGSGASDVSETGGGHPGRLSAPAVLPLPSPPPVILPEAPCTVALAPVLLPPPVWAGCPQLPAALRLGERVGLFVAVISPSPGSSLTASRLRLHATQWDDLSIHLILCIVPTPRLHFS